MSRDRSTTITVRLEDDLKDRLDALAEATHRSKSFLAAEAIRAYVENSEWQVGEILAALKEADAGDLASEKDVIALANKWKVNAGEGATQGTEGGRPPHPNEACTATLRGTSLARATSDD